MKLNVICPKCRRTETIVINQQLLREIYATGYTSISFYHTNHVLYVGMDKYGIRVIDTFDPPSTLVYGSNIVVDGIFILRNPIIPFPLSMMFYDTKNNILDARFVNDHMQAIIFARYYKNQATNNEGLLSTLGINYYVKKNGRFVVATILAQNVDNQYLQEITDRLLEKIYNVPADAKDVFEVLALRKIN